MKTDAVIVGGGPAGLAAAACLQQSGLTYTLLEKSGQVAPSWRGHYERLHLHTPKKYSALPFVPYPGHYPRYPGRQQVVDYLDSYARTLNLQARLGEPVSAARHNGGEWATHTAAGEYRSRALIVATGLNHTPNMAEWPGREHFTGPVIHASAYQTGAAYAGQDLLVVGFGNSGGEIAIDLLEHGAKVSMSVRSPVNIMPRDVLGLPIVAVTLRLQRFPPGVLDAVSRPIQRLKIGDLSPYGLQRHAFGPATQIAERARIPLVDIGTIEHIKRGRITVHPGITRYTNGGVEFTDGTVKRFDAVVLATGYLPNFDFLKDVILPDNPIHLPVRGAEGPAPNLFFSGFRVTSTGTLREIGLEAMNIARTLRASAV